MSVILTVVWAALLVLYWRAIRRLIAVEKSISDLSTNINRLLSTKLNEDKPVFGCRINSPNSAKL